MSGRLRVVWIIVRHEKLDGLISAICQKEVVRNKVMRQGWMAMVARYHCHPSVQIVAMSHVN